TAKTAKLAFVRPASECRRLFFFDNLWLRLRPAKHYHERIPNLLRSGIILVAREIQLVGSDGESAAFPLLIKPVNPGVRNRETLYFGERRQVENANRPCNIGRDQIFAAVRHGEQF